MDEENLDDEKTKVTFITAKSIKNGFEDAIKGLKRIENKTINETMVFELYKQGGGNQDDTEWDFKAVVRIGDYYLPIHLGDDHSIKIQNLVIYLLMKFFYKKGKCCNYQLNSAIS